MKKITSLSLGFSFLIMSFTGVMLFICPQGRVAYWSDWILLGLSKTQYGELHTTSMVTFLVFGILHIYYNWKPIVSYMKDSTKKVSFTKKEFLIAFLLNLAFVAGTLLAVQPFKGFLDMGEKIKNNWTEKYGEPPYGHAEESKLNVFCNRMDLDLEKAKISLNKANIIFKEVESLKVIAKNNDLSPNDIYKLIKVQNIQSDSKIPNSLGRKTLGELETMQKIDFEKASTILKEKNINNITRDSKIREIANTLEVEPLDIYNMIKN